MSVTPYLRLSEINDLIRSVLDEWMPDDYWIVAEIAECNLRRGHRYLHLIEKEDDEVIAEARANLWSSRAFLVDEFQAVTGETLKAGMELLLRVRVRFHERYGLSLEVTGLNAEFTLGGMMRRKQETLERLEREGLLTANGRLPFPLVPQRIAVISSPNAAGLGDFVVHLQQNTPGYVFSYALFPALVQGADAERSLIEALAEVAIRRSLFDVAVILRGGGSQVDLSCFDGYALGAAISRCPLPVITGVGHERDECVADRCAHTRAKTPTAAAETLICRVRDFEEELVGLAADAVSIVRRSLEFSSSRLGVAALRFTSAATHQLAARREGVKILAGRLPSGAARALARCEAALGVAAEALPLRTKRALEQTGSAIDAHERAVRLLDPANVLRRGYSITRVDGRAIRSTEGLRAGSRIATELYSGRISSTIELLEAVSGPTDDQLSAGDGAAGADSGTDRPRRRGRGRAGGEREGGGGPGADLP